MLRSIIRDVAQSGERLCGLAGYGNSMRIVGMEVGEDKRVRGINIKYLLSEDGEDVEATRVRA